MHVLRKITVTAVSIALLAISFFIFTSFVFSAPPTDTYYSRDSAFIIPFSSNPAETKIQKILLHVSEDFGKTYSHVGTALPTQKQFLFRAQKDGWYWFSVQSQEIDGRMVPANINVAQPSLKVCIDSTPPSVVLRGIFKDGSASIDWDLRDETLDLSSMRLEFRNSDGKDWVPLSAQQIAQGQHVWNPGTAGNIEVHLSVRDKCGNFGESSIVIQPNGTRAGNSSQENGSGKGNISMVKSRRFQLNYKIDDVGPSDISRVEVYVTRDGGKVWRKYDQDAPKQPPCIVDVPEEGRYGFTLVARSGVDLGEHPPKSGDLPQFWVEVDETKPIVKLIGVDVGRGIDQGNLSVTWTASDKYLGPNPINISYAKTPEGPWVVAVPNLPNTGRYVWRMPADGLPYQFFVKVEASDLAGNIGAAETTAAVKVDLSTPKARVIGVDVSPVGGGYAPPSSPMNQYIPAVPAPKPNNTFPNPSTTVPSSNGPAPASTTSFPGIGPEGMPTFPTNPVRPK
jgi:hypothetical protein